MWPSSTVKGYMPIKQCRHNYTCMLYELVFPFHTWEPAPNCLFQTQEFLKGSHVSMRPAWGGREHFIFVSANRKHIIGSVKSAFDCRSYSSEAYILVHRNTKSFSEKHRIRLIWSLSPIAQCFVVLLIKERSCNSHMPPSFAFTSEGMAQMKVNRHWNISKRFSFAFIKHEHETTCQKFAQHYLESEFGMNNFQTDHANCASSEQRNVIISVPRASVPIGALSYSCVGVLSGAYFIHMWFSTPPLRRGKRDWFSHVILWYLLSLLSIFRWNVKCFRAKI